MRERERKKIYCIYVEVCVYIYIYLKKKHFTKKRSACLPAYSLVCPSAAAAGIPVRNASQVRDRESLGPPNGLGQLAPVEGDVEP